MRLSTYSTVLALSFLAASTLSAQTPNDEKYEFAVSVGALSGSSPSVPGGALATGSGVALQANYARRFHDLKWANVYWEVDGLYSPLRHLSGFPVLAASAEHSFYLTPGLRLQFTPTEKILPWIGAGGGFAFYDTSHTSIAGGITSAAPGVTSGFSNKTGTGAIDLGAGVDFVTGKRFVVRGDVRGFYTGSPALGVNASGGQFNFVVSGGIVWRFPK